MDVNRREGGEGERVQDNKDKEYYVHVKYQRPLFWKARVIKVLFSFSTLQINTERSYITKIPRFTVLCLNTFQMHEKRRKIHHYNVNMRKNPL